MSAITGIIYHDRRLAERLTIAQMVEHAAPWAAEATGLWCEGSAALGHRMLHDTPESLLECQPFTKNGLTVTADARIDNRADLLKLLDLVSTVETPVTDVELILRAYEKWGEEAPGHLIGDFAFAIWDSRRHALFCARDPFSIRPFFYCAREKFFAFGSSIRAILAVPEVPRELNELRLACTIVKTYDEKEQTFYQHIRRLPGGRWLIVRDGSIRQGTFWNPFNIRGHRLSRDEDYAEGLREIFTEAVRCRLRSAYPVGSMLSGGMDSSSIVCIARKLLGEAGREPLHTYSAIFPSLSEVDARIDERQYIQAVVDGGGVTHHEVRADQQHPLVEPLWAGEEAIAAPNFYMDWIINKQAAAQGVRVLFSGFDGDTALSHGYERLGELAISGRWITLYREAQALARHMRCPLRWILRNYCIDPFLPDGLFNLWHRVRWGKKSVPYEGTLINPEFARRVELKHFLEQRPQPGLRDTVSARRVHQGAVTSGLMVYCLEIARRASDDAGLYQVYPFFDRRLVEFCLAMPADQKLKAGVSRSVMLRAMQGLLTPEVANRRYKGNLSSNFDRHIHDMGLPAAREIMDNQPGMIEKLFDRQAINAAVAGITAHPLRGGNDTMNLFFMIVLARWLNRAGFASHGG